MLTLAACSKDEVVQQNPNDAISFTATTGKAISRAADGYCNNVLPGDFQVWAAAQGKKYFENETYEKYNAGTELAPIWRYKPKDNVMRYWPESGTVDFFATKNEKGTPTFVETSGSTSLSFAGYAVDDNVTTQTDFIYASTKGATKGTDGLVTLNFRHALSQVEFKARNENNKIYVKIDAVKVVNVKNSGTFTISDATTNNYVKHDHDDIAETDTRVGKGSWTAQGGKQSYEATLATPIGMKGGETIELTSNDGSAEFNSNTMYLMPHTLTRWVPGDGKASESEKSYFMVKALIYNMPTTSSTPEDQVVVWGTDGGAGVFTTKYIAVSVPDGTEWKDGMRYVYTFVFKTDGNGGYDPGTNDPVLTPITLEVKVDDFVDAGNKDVNMGDKVIP